MQDFGKFLVTYWKDILSVVILIISLVLCLSRKKPVLNVLSSVALSIYDELPHIINTAESLFLDGSAKLDYVLKVALDLASEYLGHKLNSTEHDYFYSWFKERTELILSTPLKKGVDFSFIKGALSADIGVKNDKV